MLFLLLYSSLFLYFIFYFDLFFLYSSSSELAHTGSDDDLVEDLSGSLATQESEDWFEPSGPPSTSAGMLIVGSLPDRIGGDDEDDDDDDDGDDEEDEEEEDVDEEEEDMNGAIPAGRLGIPIRGRQHSRGGGGRGAVRGVGRRRSAFVASGGMNRDPQYLYIQMEYCPKKTLRNVIDEGKTGIISSIPSLLLFPSPFLPLPYSHPIYSASFLAL